MPDPARDALYIYNGGSSGTCEGIDIFKIKISDPSETSVIGRASNEGIDLAGDRARATTPATTTTCC